MPRLNTRSDYVMGIAGIQGSVNGSFISDSYCPDAYPPSWFNDDEVIIAQPSDGSIRIVNVNTWFRRLVSTIPPNVYKAGGNNWAAWSNASGLFSPNLNLSSAGLRDVGPDGAIGFVADYQSGIGCEIFEISGELWHLSDDIVYDLQLLGNKKAIWRDQFFKIQVFGLPSPVQIGNAYRPRAILINGEWWVTYWSESVGVVLHPFSSTIGYVVVPPGIDAFNHDAISFGNLVTIAWSTTAGEAPQDYREKVINVVTDQRIELGQSEKITPINRAHWLGFFAGSEGAGGGWDTNIDPHSLPGNAYLQVSSGIIFSKEDKPVGIFISGNSVEDIEQKAANALFTPVVYWDSRNWPRYPNISRDYWLCIQAYCKNNESLSAFENSLRQILGGLSHLKVALVAQCYTSNASQTTDLKSLVPIFSRLAADFSFIIATLPFSGSGRKTGLQDHPEVRPLWDEFASTITGEPPMDNEQGNLPDDVYATLVALRPKYPTPLGNRGAELINEVAWTHRNQGYGNHRKPGGTNGPQVPGSNVLCSIDIIRTKTNWWDVLGDAEGAGTPSQGETGVSDDPQNWVAPVQPANVDPPSEVGKVLIFEYDKVCRRSDPKGCLIRFEVESPDPVVQAEFNLEGDGEPSLVVHFDEGLARDGRYVRALAFKFTVNGKWVLRVTAKDNKGRAYQSDGSHIVEVTN